MEEVKIGKQEFKCIGYEGCLYYFKYIKTSFFKLKREWVLFPVYFEDETVLKDFIKMSYIFDYNYDFVFRRFGNIDSCSLSGSANINVYLMHLTNVNNELHIFNKRTSTFAIRDVSMYIGPDLSTAYDKFLQSKPFRNAKIIEEKTYKIVEEK